MRDAAVGGIPDLRPRVLIVGFGVGRVAVLVRLPRPGNLPRQAIADPVVAALVVGVDIGRAHDHLGAVGAQQRPLLLRLLVGHDEDAAIAARRGSHRQPDAGVPAGWLHDRASGLEQAGALGGLDHRQPNAVLHRSARVHCLELGHHSSRHAVIQTVQGD